MINIPAIAIISLFSFTTLWAQENKPSSQLDLEIDGLVVDQTLTKTGRDFYELFYNQWLPPPGAKNYTLLVQEQPSRGPGMGTQINIIINDHQVVTVPLQPRYTIIENHARKAVGITANYLRNFQQIQKDLDGQDKVGNGIY